MIDKEWAKSATIEANDSFRIYLTFLGMLDSHANVLFLKWPDAMQSLLLDDYEAFRKDIAQLICYPLHVLARSLREYSQNKIGKHNSTQEIDLIMKQSISDPVETKKALIRICNTEIFLLKSHGVPILPIGEGVR